MFVANIKPRKALRDVVESLWVQEDDSLERHPTSCVIPTGTIEILFHYGDLYAHAWPNGLEWMPRCYVTGQRSRPVFPVPTGRTGIVLVSLYPWGLPAFFPECIDAVDGYVDLALLSCRRRVAELCEQLVAAPDALTRLALVESFMLSRRRNQGGDLRMVAAAHALATTATAHPVHAMTRQLAMSRRHFSRAFRANIGLPPKTFARIMRFQRAIRLRRDGGLAWSAIAAECGYTDQAHLSHELKHFAARTPRDIELRRTAPDELFNGGAASKFFDTVYL